MAKALPSALVDSFLTPWDIEEQGKELPTSGKTEEEIAKYTVDEHMSDVERAVLFLNGGQLIQQRQAISSLPSIIKGRGRQAWDALAQPLKSALNRLDAEAQAATADAFATIAKDRLLSPADLQVCLLPIICRNINKEKSEEETEAWLKALLEIVPLLDKEVLKTEVMSLALSKGDVEENVNSRVICARILGALAPCLSRDEVERSFFKKAMTMCQDVEYPIRISMCQQLAAIGRAVGRELTKGEVLVEIFELLKDEEVQVREAAFSALVSLMDLMPPDVRKSQIMPVLREHMQPFELNIVMQRCIGKHFGQLLAMVKSDFEGDDTQVFYGCYKHLCAKSDVDLRRACASQYAAVLKAAASLNAAAYATSFHETLYTLATDSDEEVRVTIAGQIHDVARIAGGRETCCSLLTRPLVRLLRDESQAVQIAVLPMLNTTLQFFVVPLSGTGFPGSGGGAPAPDDPRREAALADVLRALVDMEAGAKRNWRLQANLAAVFPGFPRSFSSDQIYEHFLPMALRLMTNSVVAVRPFAAEGVVAFVRYNRRDKQRSEVFLRLIREYARGKSFTMRMAFVEVVRHMIRVFSSRFIKDWVFDLTLELLYDPVANVRLQVAPLLPMLKQAIRLPEDVDHLERLNNAISNAMTDNDRDVSSTARSVNDTFKRTPVRMVGGMGVMDMNGLAGGMSNYESEDKKKEEEEADYQFLPEDAKEVKAEILQVSYRKKDGGPMRSNLGKRMSNSGQVPPMGRVGGLSSYPGSISGAGSKAPGGPSMGTNRPGPLTATPAASMSLTGARGGIPTSAGRVVGTSAAAASGRPPVPTPGANPANRLPTLTNRPSASSATSTSKPQLPSFSAGTRQAASSSTSAASAKVLTSGASNTFGAKTVAPVGGAQRSAVPTALSARKPMR